MKLRNLKIILMVITLILIGAGCGSSSVQKIDDKLLNHFSTDQQAILKEANPDLVTMEYLVAHASDYATTLTSDRNDFFVVVHGTVTNLKKEEYDDAILDGMDPEMANLLRGKTGVDIYLDNCSTALTDADNEYNVEINKEYYFFVLVKDGASGYRYTPFACFNFD